MILPLTNNPEEEFNIVIQDVIYNIRQLWNGHGFWTLDIRNFNGDDLVLGVKVVAKEYLLKQYPHILFDLQSDSSNDPGRYDLETFNLVVTVKNV